MEKKILVIIFIAVAAALITAWIKGAFSIATPTGVKVKIGGYEYSVEVVDTGPAMAQGLSDRDSLAPDHGMLFVFNPARSEVFWMHGMRFPIDIVWIANGRVTGVVHRAPVPEGISTPMFNSPGIVDYVLEVPADTALKNGIVAGSEVSILGYDARN